MTLLRTRASVLSLGLLCLAVVATSADARRRRPQGTHVPGVFDYYVLSLSWSPEHCASHPGETQQCSGVRRYGFVLHGLWPQYERGYPESCAAGAALSASQIALLLDLSPSEKLVRHEWAKHGTCSGRSPEDYFALARRAFESIQVPARFRAPSQAARLSVAALEAELATANPGLSGAHVAVQCGGRFLREVQVCLDKDLRPRSCGHDVRDGCRGEVIVRPVR